MISTRKQWTETLFHERHAPGKGKGKVSGDEWRPGVWNARGVNDIKERESRETMHARKLDILCVPETKKKGCDLRKTENGDLKGEFELWSGVDSESHGS